jgi:acetyltransferase-like isoleucine patch superfamily enzyme
MVELKADSFVHPSADVSPDASVGAGCQIWGLVHIREHAQLGPGCKIGDAAYIGPGVRLGANCKVLNQALLYEGVELEDGVFVGPQVCFTNDFLPRAVNPDLSLKSADDWQAGRTRLREGASIGAQSVVITGVTIGRWALIGAGTVVTHDVPDHALVYGSPGKIRGWVCRCARPVRVRRSADGELEGWCEVCQKYSALPAEAAEFIHAP